MKIFPLVIKKSKAEVRYSTWTAFGSRHFRLNSFISQVRRNLWISYYPTCLNSPFPFPASICLLLWAWMPSHWILLSAAISFQFPFHCPLHKTPHSFLANNYHTLQLISQLWNDTMLIEQSPQMYSWSFWEWHGESGLSCIWEGSHHHLQKPLTTTASPK